MLSETLDKKALLLFEKEVLKALPSPIVVGGKSKRGNSQVEGVSTEEGVEAPGNKGPQSECPVVASMAHTAAIGLRHGSNPAAGGGFVWDLLPARLAIFRRLAAEPPAACPRPSPQISTWLRDEIQILETGCAIANQMGHACALADDLIALPQSLSLLEQQVQRAISEMMTQHGRELHLPVLHASEWQDGPAHCTFLGLRRITIAGHHVLRLRVDDSDIGDPAATSDVLPTADSRRAKSAPWVAMLDIGRLARPALAAEWAQVLSPTQTSHSDFIARLAYIIAQARSHQPEVTIIAQGLRPMAVQAGDTCVLKNHGRGCASRLQECIAAAQNLTLHDAAPLSQEAWRWFRAAERQLALSP